MLVVSIINILKMCRKISPIKTGIISTTKFPIHQKGNNSGRTNTITRPIITCNGSPTFT